MAEREAAVLAFLLQMPAPFDVIGRPTADGKGAELWTVTPMGTIAAQATATLA